VQSLAKDRRGVAAKRARRGAEPVRCESYSSLRERRLSQARMLTGRLTKDTPADHSSRIILSFD